MRAHGIDVSHWKPVKDWTPLANSDTSFIGIKATEGLSYVDPTLRAHRDGARKQPFALVIYYHFGRSGPARKQAERLMDAVGTLRDNERLCLDLEVVPTLDPLDGIDWVDEFYAELMSGSCTDRRPLIYTSKRKWREIGDPPWDLASEVGLWAPRYGSGSAEPLLPLPWAALGWDFWQYSDGEQPSVITPGVGRCDANLFRGTESDLHKYARIARGAVAPVT